MSRERDQIQEAIERLLQGRPLRSTGELTVVQLAAEADVKRWLLTHKHVDLMHRFQAEVRRASGESPLVVSWREKVSKLKQDLDSLRAENAQLREQVAVYAQVIDDLSSALEIGGSATPVPLRSVRT